MLAIHPAARDFHHAYARDNCSGNEGAVYRSLHDASDDNYGSNCYILSSSTDPTWLVVCGKSPSSFGQDELAHWFRDVTIKGRIEREHFIGTGYAGTKRR